MPRIHDLELFALAALVMGLTPGPNMIYLLSRSLSQGRRAGLVSLIGIVVGFFFHMSAAILGLTAMLLTIPYAYIIMKLIGAGYLLWLGFRALTQTSSPFTPKDLPIDSTGKLFRIGLITNLLNPQVAIFYMSLLPQFLKPENGSILAQSLILGVTQITISSTLNFIVVLTAGTVSTFFKNNPQWLRIQKWVVGLTLLGLALRVLVSK